MEKNESKNDAKEVEIKEEDIKKLQKINEQLLIKQTQEATKNFENLLNDIFASDVPTFLKKYGMLPADKLMMLIEFKRLQIMEDILFSLPKEEKE